MSTSWIVLAEQADFELLTMHSSLNTHPLLFPHPSQTPCTQHFEKTNCKISAAALTGFLPGAEPDKLLEQPLQDVHSIQSHMQNLMLLPAITK